MSWEKEVKIDNETKIKFLSPHFFKKRIPFRLYHLVCENYKGFKKDNGEWNYGDSGCINIISGKVFLEHHFKFSKDKIRKAWLKVEDELRRRGWINIDGKLGDKK